MITKVVKSPIVRRVSATVRRTKRAIAGLGVHHCATSPLLLFVDILDQNGTRCLRPMKVLIAGNAEISRVDPDLFVCGLPGQSVNEIMCAMPVIAQVHVYAVYKKQYRNAPLADFRATMKV